MSTQEIIALLGGAVFVGVVIWANQRADDKGAGVKLGQLSPEEDSFHHEPHAEDLRLLRICTRCSRYQGPRREIHFGQHLNVIHDICPACAKRRDAEAAAATDTKVRKLAIA
ncbi:MAG: hypothetical protein EBS05_10200 [Proteobacteria bacterium]|nr:hypothetical protein [Pseudomonadota bacterium]NDE98297.1 hypothetical protein [Verrucomicrobiota bacterium]